MFTNTPFIQLYTILFTYYIRFSIKQMSKLSREHHNTLIQNFRNKF